MQESKMAVWRGLTNSCEKKRSEKHARTGASQEFPRAAAPVGVSPRTSLVAQTVKRLPTMWETLVQSLGREDPLEKEEATHSSSCLENPMDGGAW